MMIKDGITSFINDPRVSLPIYSIVEDKKNNILVGGKYHIWRYDGMDFYIFFIGDNMRNMLVDRYNNIWFTFQNSTTWEEILAVYNEDGLQGINGIKDSEISTEILFLYPNPASDYIEFSSPPLERGSGGVAPVHIFDLLGVEITTPNLTPTLSEGEGVVRLDVSGLSPGVYFVRVGEVVRKFVKY
jgi:hypothetical protein